jgi:hypothetical protein
LEENIRKIYTDLKEQGKASVELESPSIMLHISNANPEDLDFLLKLLMRIKEDPLGASRMELYRGN